MDIRRYEKYSQACHFISRLCRRQRDLHEIVESINLIISMSTLLALLQIMFIKIGTLDS